MKLLLPSALRADSRPGDAVVCFRAGNSVSWSDFSRDLALIRARVGAARKERWVLSCEDGYHFLCAVIAVLQLKKEVLLCANTTPSFLAEIVDGSTGYLCDERFGGFPTVADILNPDESPEAPVDLSFPPIDPITARIVLHTSGSTGRPKAFPKRLTELETEVGELVALWGGLLEGRRVYATVNHQHIYGFLFAALLPLAVGMPLYRDLVRYPESLEALGDPRPVLVCSPAFLKRVAETDYATRPFVEPLIFSSGGVLPPPVAREVEARLGSAPLEIYGSTETGGIAHRRSVHEASWLPFPRNQVRIDEEGRVVVASPYILDPAGFVSGDLARWVGEGRFVLEGRSDLIVKIEEKRVSLAEVETRLMESSFVKDACAVALSGKRQYLGAAIALNDEGKKRFAGVPKKDINAHFRDHLAAFLEGAVIPKKWRFVDSIPRNTQDKVLRADVAALFAGQDGVLVRSTSVDGNRAWIELVVGAESPFFDGHFPSYKLLPAVAQFDIAMRLGAELLGTTKRIRAIQRVKFKSPISPGVALTLSLTHDPEAGRLQFEYAAADTGAEYSGGSITLEKS